MKKGKRSKFSPEKSGVKRKEDERSTAKLKVKNTRSKLIRRKKKTEQNYSVGSIQSALNALGEGQSLRSVASQFQIPKSTLYVKYKNITHIGCRKGPAAVLSMEVDN